MLEDIAQHAYQRLTESGGVTVSMQGVEPTSGYAYSPFPELERVLPQSTVTPDTILQYLNDNAQALAMPGNFLGAWLDTQSGNVFLDVSHVGPPDEATIAEAAKANQVAVYDLSNFNEIPTGVQRDRGVTSAVDHQTVLDANAGQNLQGLPGPVNVPGVGPLQFHAHRDIQRLANEYNAANGLGAHPTDYQRVNPERAAQIAQEYERMPHMPHDPNVAAAYNALVRETRAQYDHAVNNGYRFEFYPDHDPYPNSPREAVLDLHHNKHMYVYPTFEGYGNEGQDSTDHPLLADSGVRWNGKPVTHNDLFRAVHDFYGHAKEGLGFRADGEDNAYRQHAAMFSDQARRALTSETRGQNSWVNFGPHGEHNQTATSDTIYAPQKAGLMPDWTMDSDMHRQSSWEDAFKLDSGWDSHSYTREGSTRLNSTFHEADGWQVVRTVDPARLSHVNRPDDHEVVLGHESHSSMPICTVCQDDVHYASAWRVIEAPTGNSHSGDASRPYLVNSSTGQIYLGQSHGGHADLAKRYNMDHLRGWAWGLISPEGRTMGGMMVPDEAHRAVADYLSLPAKTAWQLPEDYGWLGPQSLEEHALISQPHKDAPGICPQCGATTRFPLGFCPHCGYHPEQKMDEAAGYRVSNVWEWANGSLPAVAHLSWIDWPNDGDDFIHDLDSQDNGQSTERDPTAIEPGSMDTGEWEAVTDWENEGGPTREASDSSQTVKLPFPTIASGARARELTESDTRSETKPLHSVDITLGATPLDELVHSLGLDTWDHEALASAWSMVDRHSAYDPDSLDYGTHRLTDNRPSCKEFLMSSNIRESTERAAGQWESFSNNSPRFHVAPAMYRDAILKGGLLPNEPQGYPKGVYTFEDLENAQFFADHMQGQDELNYGEGPENDRDIWEVHHRGPWEQDPAVTSDDPFQAEYPKPLRAGYHTGPIEPRFLRRLGSARFGTPDGTRLSWQVPETYWEQSPKWNKLYHITTPERAQRIMQEGLRPWDEHGFSNYDPNQEGASPYANRWLVPRPGHVYLTRDPKKIKNMGQDRVVLEIDPRMLDPMNINPDEDNNRRNRWAPDISKGQLAENQGFGDDPQVTQQTLERPSTHAVAYRGTIPPEAIRLGSHKHAFSEMGPAQIVEKTEPNDYAHVAKLPERVVQGWGWQHAFGAVTPSGTPAQWIGPEKYLGDHSFLMDPQTGKLFIGSPDKHHMNLYDMLGPRGQEFLPGAIYDEGFETYYDHDNPHWDNAHAYFQQLHAAEPDADYPLERRQAGWSHLGSLFDGTDEGVPPGMTVKPEAPVLLGGPDPKVIDWRDKLEHDPFAGHGTNDFPYFWDMKNNEVHLGPRDWYHDDFRGELKNYGLDPYYGFKNEKGRWALGRSNSYRPKYAPVFRALENHGVPIDDGSSWGDVFSNHLAAPYGNLPHDIPDTVQVVNGGQQITNAYHARPETQTFPWEPGKWGKAVFRTTPKGHEFHVWATDEECGWPHHGGIARGHRDMLDTVGSSPGFDVRPDGVLNKVYDSGYDALIPHPFHLHNDADSWSDVFAKTADYYHRAPTFERQRILQHGLVPGKPKDSERWTPKEIPTRSLNKQPEGIYVTDTERGFPMGGDYDTWRIPADLVQGVEKDRRAPNSWIIPHRVEPVLHQRHEDSDAAASDATRAWFDQERLPGETDAELEPWQMNFEWAQNADKRGVPFSMDEYMRQKGVGFPTHVIGSSPHSLVWEPGWPGKGIYHNGELTTWGINSTTHFLGWPHHAHMWAQRYPDKPFPGLNDPNSLFVNIEPEGQVREAHPFQGEWPEEMYQIEPRFKRYGEEGAWANEFM